MMTKGDELELVALCRAGLDALRSRDCTKYVECRDKIAAIHASAGEKMLKFTEKPHHGPARIWYADSMNSAAIRIVMVNPAIDFGNRSNDEIINWFRDDLHGLKIESTGTEMTEQQITDLDADSATCETLVRVYKALARLRGITLDDGYAHAYIMSIATEAWWIGRTSEAKKQWLSDNIAEMITSY